MARGSKNTATGFDEVAGTNKDKNESNNVETNESNKEENNLTTKEENNVSMNQGSLQSKKQETNESTDQETRVQRKRVSFDIRVDLHKRLKVQSANMERNIYELIEEAIEKHLNELE